MSRTHDCRALKKSKTDEKMSWTVCRLSSITLVRMVTTKWLTKVDKWKRDVGSDCCCVPFLTLKCLPMLMVGASKNKRTLLEK
jgi:hypothetical protein